MGKFNEEIYKGITKNKEYKDQYNYKYIIVDKNLIYRSYYSTYYDSMEYKFFGILSKEKKDIFTMNNIDELQKEFNEEAEKEAINEIMKNYEYYVNIQKENFNKKIENEDFKRSILYDYIENKFNQFFVKNVKIEELKKSLIDNIIYINKNMNNKDFINKYINESKNDIIIELKNNIFSGKYINEWDFNYNWNNSRYETEETNIEFSFDNNISLQLNKIELIVSEYKKIYNDPCDSLKKAKKLYNLCNNFKNEHNNKTCYLYLKDNTKLKVLDFKQLIWTFEQGKEKAISYRLFTNKEIEILNEYNEKTKDTTWNDDLYILDIKKLEFNNKIIFEE